MSSLSQMMICLEQYCSRTRTWEAACPPGAAGAPGHQLNTVKSALSCLVEIHTGKQGTLSDHGQTLRKQRKVSHNYSCSAFKATLHYGKFKGSFYGKGPNVKSLHCTEKLYSIS